MVVCDEDSGRWSGGAGSGWERIAGEGEEGEAMGGTGGGGGKVGEVTYKGEEDT